MSTTRPRPLTARCQGQPELFDSKQLLDHQRARVLCSACPVMRDCLDDALEQSRNRKVGSRAVPDGTWGGLLWRNGQIFTGSGQAGR